MDYGINMETCQEHSGCITDIQNLKDDVKDHGTMIERIEGKLNMILGAIILSPFIVGVFTMLLTKPVGG